jgi:hypothetical protein
MIGHVTNTISPIRQGIVLRLWVLENATLQLFATFLVIVLVEMLVVSVWPFQKRRDGAGRRRKRNARRAAARRTARGVTGCRPWRPADG